MQKNKLLVIDDDRDILTVLKANLELQGFEVSVATNWKEGSLLFNQINPDLLILDLTLPDTDGLSICKSLRDAKEVVPIIMLTARDKLSDKIIGLESGADDYIVKPFETLELIARIHACLRRSKGKSTGEEEVIAAKDVFIDLKKRIVKSQGRQLDLTAKEFSLLCFLMRHKGEVVSREQIKKHLWKDSQLYSWSRVIDVHIQHLRQKLDYSNHNRYITTVPSVGYKFVED